jgi:hypothetical protein
LKPSRITGLMGYFVFAQILWAIGALKRTKKLKTVEIF